MAAVSNVLIVGAGPAGLSSAIALRRAGMDVEIVERSPIRDVPGSELKVGGSFLRTLDALGVAERCVEVGIGLDRTRLCAAAGQVLTEVVMPHVARDDLPLAAGITRNNLLGIPRHRVVNAPNPDRLPEERFPELLREVLAEYGGVMEEVREQIHDRGQIYYSGLVSLILPVPWHRGRVLLIDDAAHTCTPHLAYGAGIAAEDGVVLGQVLSTYDGLPPRWRHSRIAATRDAGWSWKIHDNWVSGSRTLSPRPGACQRS